MSERPAPNSTSERALNLAKTFVDAGFDVRGVEVDGRKMRVLFKGDAPEVESSVEDELAELELKVVGG